MTVLVSVFNILKNIHQYKARNSIDVWILSIYFDLNQKVCCTSLEVHDNIKFDCLRSRQKLKSMTICCNVVGTWTFVSLRISIGTRVDLESSHPPGKAIVANIEQIATCTGESAVK